MKLFLVLALLFPLSALAIVGGERIDDGRFLQSVALAYKASPSQPDSEIYCSGTLIGPGVVLTAAHCLSSGAKAFGLTKDEFIRRTWIYVGDSPAENIKPRALAQYEVLSAMIHPASDAISSDVAMLILKTPVDIQKWGLTPAPLTIAERSMIGRELIHVGFGMTENNGSKGTKSLFAAPLRALNGYNGLEVGEMFKSGPGACNGDSGGSAYLHDVDGVIKFIGVENAISNRPCGNAATYFVPVTDRMLQWIRSAKLPLFE